jgi:hypothetical protein
MENFITKDGYNQSVVNKNITSNYKSKFGFYSVAQDSVYFVEFFFDTSHIQDTPVLYNA